MQSGIAINDDVRETFQQMRMRRKHRYIVFKASEDQTTIEVEKIGERNETWEQFKEAMPKNNSR